MHSGRLGHHGHRCHDGAHEMGIGRAGACERDSLHGQMNCCGLVGGQGPWYGQHNQSGRTGERFGWGREGRVRLDDSPTCHRRRASLDALVGGLGGVGGLNIGGLGGGLNLGGGAGLFGRHRGPFDPLQQRVSPLLGRGRGLDASLQDLRDYPYYLQQLSLGGLGARGCLGGGRQLPLGNIGLGLGAGLRPGSLRSVSSYSLDHLDRLPRPYHYQPPFAEDYESLFDEDLDPEMDLMEWGGGLVNRGDFYRSLPPGYDVEDVLGRRSRR